MKKYLFLEFIISLIRTSVNFFSLITFLIAIIFVLFRVNFIDNKDLMILWILLSFIFSSYRIWKDKVLMNDSKKSLRIVKVDSCFSPRAYIGDGRIDNNSYFSLGTEFVNNSDSKVYLEEVKVKKIKINSGLFDTNPKKIQLKMMPHHRPITIPYCIEKGEKVFVRIDIDVNMLNNDAVYLAENINNLIDFNIILSVSYEVMNDNKYVDELIFDGDFNEFKKGITKFWEEKKLYELLYNSTKRN